MNKENKRLAQEKRAQERKKKARRAMIQRISLGACIVVVLLGIIIYGAIDSKQNGTDQAADSNNDTTSVDANAVTEPTLQTDDSLVVENGDVVDIDYAGTVDGIAFEGGTGSFNLEIGSHSFIDDFEEQLIGHHVGETVEVEVTFPEGYKGHYTDADGESKSLSGADAVFMVTIVGIYR